MILNIKSENQALFSQGMRNVRIYYFELLSDNNPYKTRVRI